MYVYNNLQNLPLTEWIFISKFEDLWRQNL